MKRDVSIKKTIKKNNTTTTTTTPHQKKTPPKTKQNKNKNHLAKYDSVQTIW